VNVPLVVIALVLPESDPNVNDVTAVLKVLSPRKNVVEFLVPVADKSIVPKLTAPLAVELAEQ